jgi:hypothetical protein
MATADRRATDELLALYALEGFLDRLSSSPRADDLVLKGGVLLAAARDVGRLTSEQLSQGRGSRAINDDVTRRAWP